MHSTRDEKEGGSRKKHKEHYGLGSLPGAHDAGPRCAGSARGPGEWNAVCGEGRLGKLGERQQSRALLEGPLRRW